MGQNVSSLDPVDMDFSDKELVDLTDAQLSFLLQLPPAWTPSLVLDAAPDRNSSSSSSQSMPSGYYSSEIETPHVLLARRLNKLSLDLAHLRFSMVPTKLKEPIFWEAVLTILQERLEKQYNDFDHQNDDNPYSESVEETHMSNGKNTKKSSSSDEDDSKDRQIRLLRKQVRELQAALKQQKQKNASLANNPSKSNNNGNNNSSSNGANATGGERPQVTKVLSQHSGSWVMDEESKAFLEYPQELKDNMRREKQKRLQQVHKDMQFILDSDQIHHTNGRWDCCGKTDYHSDCTCRKR